MSYNIDSELRHSDWLRSMKWDLPTDKDLFLATIGENNLEHFLTLPAAQAMPQSLKDELSVKGGPGSGHFGHAGRQGEVGGSLPSGSGTSELWQQSRDEYAPHPYSNNPNASDEELRDYHKRFQDWKQSMFAAISLGKITPEEASNKGFYDSNVGWKTMPPVLYHVTTAADAVESTGLKTRYELAQSLGAGLGGGEDKTISFTESLEVASGINYAMHEAHEVASGAKTAQDMLDEAKAGTGAPRPFYNDIMTYYDRSWKHGDALPLELDAQLRGKYISSGNLGEPPRGLSGTLAGDWKPSPRDKGWQGANKRYYSYWERTMTPDEIREKNFSLYQKFAFWRDAAGGRSDPLFFLSDHKALAEMNPNQIAIMEYRPASERVMGYQVSALGEWRTGSGQAVKLTKRLP